MCASCPATLIIAACRTTTEHDKKMKHLVRNNCTSCHTPSYTLQHKFDEAGWTAIIDLMKMVNVSGVYQGEKAKPNGAARVQREGARRLSGARARAGRELDEVPAAAAPDAARRRASCSANTTCRPTPTMRRCASNDGHDWSLGTPSRIGSLVHDAWSDLDGNLWFTSNAPNRNVTVGRIDTKTGAVKFLKVPKPNGLAANTHGMYARQGREPVVQRHHRPSGGLAKLDPKTEKIEVYMPPQGMSPTGGAVTVDIDGKGIHLGVVAGRRAALRSRRPRRSPSSSRSPTRRRTAPA